MVRTGDTYTPVTGNQLGVLLIDYIINARRRTGTMPEKPGVVSSIVTTNMARAVCEANDVHYEDTFTGFKYMAERVASWEAANTYTYLFAYEESYGYMMGEYVRDKDAVTAAMMVAEMAAYYHEKGMTLVDAMNALYEKYGWFKEYTMNLVMPGLDGLQKMKALMKELRTNPPKEIGGQEVLRTRDYADGSISVAGLGKVGTTALAGSNVLYFELADGSSFIVRPSGTEPKIKIYLLVRGTSSADCDEKIEKYRDEGVVTEHFTSLGNVFCLVKFDRKTPGGHMPVKWAAYLKGTKVCVVSLKPENTLAEAMTVVDIMLAKNE
jgi:phosphoglucomutase